MNHVFDMDGVLLASNRIKSAAFYAAGALYGDGAGEWFRDFHQRAGSISRRARVERFLEWVSTSRGAELLVEPDAEEVERVLAAIAGHIGDGYLTCAEVPGVSAYLARLPDSAIVVSGVEQADLGAILAARGLVSQFDGIYGGDKHEILQRLVSEGSIPLPAVYYGDTLDDYEAATASGMDFVLVTCDAEWDWRPWVVRHSNVRVIEDFRELLSAVPANPATVRVGRDGYALVDGERLFFGRMLAGATVTVAAR